MKSGFLNLLTHQQGQPVNAPANTFLRVNECNSYIISYFIKQITDSIYIV